MLNVVFAVAVLCFGSSVFAQSHSSIDSTRSTFNRNVFFDQSLVGFNSSLNFSGDSAAVNQMGKGWTGFGIRDGFGLELYKFIHLSILHTHVDQEGKGEANASFEANELSGNLSFNFASPIGNLGFGAGIVASRASLQTVEKSSRYSGSGQLENISWNYFMTPSFSLTSKVERAHMTYHQGSGNTGISKFTSNRTGMALGFKIWL